MFSDKNVTVSDGKLHLTFDSKTMPEWFGMPNDKDLPSTFSIEYVRVWKSKWHAAIIAECPTGVLAGRPNHNRSRAAKRLSS